MLWGTKAFTDMGGQLLDSKNSMSKHGFAFPEASIRREDLNCYKLPELLCDALLYMEQNKAQAGQRLVPETVPSGTLEVVVIPLGSTSKPRS